MWLKEVIWLDKFVSKIQAKHNVTYGKTQAGRYLFIVFVYKSPMRGLIISARDMTIKERRYYNAKKS